MEDKFRFLTDSLKDRLRDFHLKIPIGIIMGREYRKIRQFVEKTQWWHADQLREYQDRKIRLLINHCYQNVPYYKDVMNSLGLLPKDIVCGRDLHKLPIIDKQTVLMNTDKMLSTNWQVYKPEMAKTGGSSGKQLTIWRSKTAILYELACDIRSFEWAGYYDGDKCILARKPLTMLDKKGNSKLWYYHFGRKWLQIGPQNLFGDGLKKLIEKIIDYQPRILISYPSNLVILANCFRNSGQKILSLKSIITTSETLYSWQKKLAEDVFCVNVFDQYGQAETVAGAFQCEKGKYHAYSENAYVEIVDQSGNLIEKGRGELVGTALNEYSMPLIRYRMEDFVNTDGATCSCGRSLFNWDRIEGRDWGTFICTNGSLLSALNLYTFIKPVLAKGNLGQVQIEQKDPLHIKCYFVKDQNFSMEDKDMLIHILKEKLGSEMIIKEQFVVQIEKSPSGKFKPFICNNSSDSF